MNPLEMMATSVEPQIKAAKYNGGVALAVLLAIGGAAVAWGRTPTERALGAGLVAACVAIFILMIAVQKGLMSPTPTTV